MFQDIREEETLQKLKCCVTRKRKNHTSIDTLKIEMTHTYKHLTFKSNFQRKYNC